MNTVRVATFKDKEQFRSLWEICFGDSRDFTDWFFRERFIPEYCVCIEENNKIISCMQAYPLSLLVRGKLVKSAILCGVCTHPDFRKKGYMSKIFTAEMNLLFEKNIVLAPHTPAVLESYFSFGHYPVADAALLYAERLPDNTASPVQNIEYITKLEPFLLGGVYDCYHSFSQKYSGMVYRSMADFVCKAKDYFADGGQGLLYKLDGKVNAYCFYYKTDQLLQAVEFVADGRESEETLLKALLYEGKGLKFEAKLCPEATALFPMIEAKIKQKSVMGCVNLPAFLSIVCGKKGYPIRMKDNILLQNNGIFDMDGQQSAEEPIFEISVGRLTQALVGYRTLQEIEDSGEMKVFDRGKMEEINAFFQKEICYIIDEY